MNFKCHLNTKLFCSDFKWFLQHLCQVTLFYWMPICLGFRWIRFMGVRYYSEHHCNCSSFEKYWNYLIFIGGNTWSIDGHAEQENGDTGCLQISLSRRSRYVNWILNFLNKVIWIAGTSLFPGQYTDQYSSSTHLLFSQYKLKINPKTFIQKTIIQNTLIQRHLSNLRERRQQK